MRIACFLVFILLCSACKQDAPPIPKKQMAEILADIHLAESYAQLIPVPDGEYMSSNKDTLRFLYSNIYKENNLDTTAFLKALSWYEAHPKVFDEVYEEVLAKLSVRKEILKDSVTSPADTVQQKIIDTL